MLLDIALNLQLCSATVEFPLSQRRTFTMNKEHNFPQNMKETLINNLVRQAPPGEFINVFNDIRFLVKDDKIMHEQAAEAWALHNKDYFTPMVKDGLEVLLSRHNDLGNSRFFDPDQKVAFHYCHLTGEIKDPQLYPIEMNEDELWRMAFNESLSEYVKRNFSAGNCSVYRKPGRGKNIFVACIEGHQFNPSSFWNGLWKSEWMFDLTPPVTKAMGNIMVQVHYYENGNIHLTAAKSVEETLFLNNEIEASKDFTELVESADREFQTALMEEFKILSDQTLKELRRQLPVTRANLDWNKILAPQILKTETA
ncbi:F-actin-capping protein subunit alpha-1-like isoform X2 [Lissotriton helveticus]